jgi:hypothetical protein
MIGFFVFLGIIFLVLIVGVCIDKKHGTRNIPNRIPGETCMQRKEMNK